jgi:hypothetical protein
MAALTPLLIFIAFIFGMTFLIGAPLIGALILSRFTRWFKFKKTDFRTALYSVLIVFGIMIAISSGLSMLFLDQIMQWQLIFTVIAILISFISGFIVIYKFYKESLGRCFGVWILTCISGMILYALIIIMITIIFGTFL